MMRRALPPLLLVAALAGCDAVINDDFEPEIVVSAFIGADETLPDVTVRTTSPFLDPFDPGALGVSGAEVSITLLAADGSDAAVSRYREVAGLPGRYEPVGATSTFVLQGVPGRTYRLDVAVDGQAITAETTVPPALETVSVRDREVVYGVGNGPGVVVTRSTQPGGRQAAFIGSTRSLDPSDFVEVRVDGETRYRSVPGTGSLPTPVYARFLDCEPEGDPRDGGTILCGDNPRQQDVVVGTSPVINEASYIDLGDGTLLVEIPFLAFGYFGPYRLSLVSIDAAYQAFVQTQAVQLGGSTLSPGEIPNVTTNVEGALGVFGSYARTTVETRILEPDF